MTDKELKKIASKSIEDMAVSIYNQAVDDIANAILNMRGDSNKFMEMKHFFSNFVKEQKL